MSNSKRLLPKRGAQLRGYIEAYLPIQVACVAKEAADAVAEQEIVNAGGEAVLEKEKVDPTEVVIPDVEPVFMEEDETSTNEFITYNVRNRPSKTASSRGRRRPQPPRE